MKSPPRTIKGFNLFMYDYCTLQNFINSESVNLHFLKLKTSELLLDFRDKLNQPLKDFTILDCFREQKWVKDKRRLVKNIIELWIPSYIYFRNNIYTKIYNDIFKTISYIDFSE